MVKKVVIESPYSGDIPTNIEYLLECMHDSYYIRGEAPYASHLLYTRLPQSQCSTNEVYQGHVTDHPASRHGRQHGIECGFAWGAHADLVAVYCDRGISEGMRAAIEHWETVGLPIEFRYIKNI